MFQLKSVRKMETKSAALFNFEPFKMDVYMGYGYNLGETLIAPMIP